MQVPQYAVRLQMGHLPLLCRHGSVHDSIHLRPVSGLPPTSLLVPPSIYTSPPLLPPARGDQYPLFI